MKILTTLVALLLAGTVYANVNGDENLAPKKKVAIVNNVEAKYKLVYINENQGAVLINIFNDKGSKVHSQTVLNKEGFAQQFDFTSLPEGSYTFEVVHPDGSVEAETINYTKTPAAALKANVLSVDNDRKYRLAVLNNAGPVDVKIFDNNDRLVHESTVRHPQGFRRIYDMKDLKGSFYKFEITDNNSTVTLVTQ
ncbi:hypothetical protein LVD17_09330 [Fulvivirga ulvae]|uniref:hypothetical protein n=1 Tax=Fulvivirga ulvae TaxID=2904245 RepID=UPI001F43675B|nr:hypothetical protein [Fulvivirga ulvae]UII34014.1 hypothetical protein LVD17_09330 [Fulvivirga ulvae]